PRMIEGHSSSAPTSSVSRRSARSGPKASSLDQLVAENPNTRDGTGTPCKCTTVIGAPSVRRVAPSCSLACCRCASIAPFLCSGPDPAGTGRVRFLCSLAGAWPDDDRRMPVKGFNDPDQPGSGRLHSLLRLCMAKCSGRYRFATTTSNGFSSKYAAPVPVAEGV